MARGSEGCWTLASACFRESLGERRDRAHDVSERIFSSQAIVEPSRRGVGEVMRFIQVRKQTKRMKKRGRERES
jgi:hypothetical protein